MRLTIALYESLVMKQRTATMHPRAAWTLIELIATVCILSLMIGLSLCGVQRVRNQACVLQCQNQLRQLGLATQNYHASHGILPKGISFPSNLSLPSTDCCPGISVHTQLLGFLEQDVLGRRAYEAHILDPYGMNEEHRRIAAIPLKSFRCPADSRIHGRFPSKMEYLNTDIGWALNNYPAVAGTHLNNSNGVFGIDRTFRLTDVKDGTSSTLLFGERPTGPNGFGSSWYANWGVLLATDGQLLEVSVRRANQATSYAPCNLNLGVYQRGKYDDACYQGSFWSLHNQGSNFLFCDGHVKFLTYSAVKILPMLATRNGREAVNLE